MLLNAGAVLYCKTNVPQTLMAMDSMNNVFGQTLNPLNRLLTPGGSSGGEGALIAMRGSVLGVGTDIGGSIRVPAMCNGLYGIKPSVGRVPYDGQENATLPATGRIGLQASAGPIAATLRDCELFLKAVIDSQPWKIDADCIPALWSSCDIPTPHNKPLRIGIMRTDGTTTPLPPISHLLNQVAETLRSSTGIEPMDLDITSLTKPLQSLTNNLLSTDGGQHKFDLLSRTGEPTIEWVAQRMKPGPPKTLEQARALHERREQAAAAFLSVWRGEAGVVSRKTTPRAATSTSSTEGMDWLSQGLPLSSPPSLSPSPAPLDAIICPVAPHPVPPVNRWNATGYTAMWVLLDYPAGVLPVRTFSAADASLEFRPDEAVAKGSWDRVNRELWDGPASKRKDGGQSGTKMDRSVYLGSPLCIQVVVPRFQEGRLVRVMRELDEALRPLREERERQDGLKKARL